MILKKSKSFRAVSQALTRYPHLVAGISGCGLPCRDPLYTEDEHQQIHRLVAWGAGACLALNLLTVATFLIDWRSANKYPALVIFYINVCFAVASMG